MPDLVRSEKSASVVVVTIDNPPANMVSDAVCTALAKAVKQAASDKSVKGIVITGAGRTFAVSAEGGASKLRDLVAQIEDCPKPVVAGIGGACMGAGLELAMACHYRVAGIAAALGLPDINLGLLPSAGGTQRLPRLVGAKTALDMIVQGTPLKAEAAKEAGLVDEVTKSSPVEAAAAFARRAFADNAKHVPAAKRTDKFNKENAPPVLFDDYRKTMRRQRGFEAPFQAVALLEEAASSSFAKGLSQEAKVATKAAGSTQSKAQRYIAFAERESAKIPDVPPDTPTKEIKSAAVIGAGTMGGGIAMTFANAGIPTIVIDADKEGLDRGLARVKANYDFSVKSGRFTEADVEKRMGLLTPSTDIRDIKDADVLVEAVFEDINLKKDIFGKIDQYAKPDAILGTNSSGLDIDVIAQATKRPESVIGIHFFAPANVMRLLENVRAAKTGKVAIATAMKLGRTLGKMPVLAGLCPGFIGNRILRVYFGQCDKIMWEGAYPDQIDKAIFDFGFAQGPYGVRDQSGLDIGYQARKAQGGSNERRFLLSDTLCDMGRRGQKTGAGFYKYEKGDRTPHVDPEVNALIDKLSADLGIKRRKISQDEIIERIIYPMINEGAKITEEGIALRASDVDVTYIHGYGFPRYRGGLMFYADTVGPKKVYDVMKRLEKEEGEGMKPAALLEKLAKNGGSFTGWI